MDKNFLEFWGNMMLNAAKGQKQMDEMSKWMEKGMSSMKEMNEMFFKFYGIQPSKSETKDQASGFEAIQKNAFSKFTSSFEDYLQFFDAVPKKKYMELVKKYEDLKQQLKDQEESIQHLRMMMEETDDGKNDVVKKFNKVISMQASQFKKLMDDFGSMATAAKPAKKKAAPKTKPKKKATPAKKAAPKKAKAKTTAKK